MITTKPNDGNPSRILVTKISCNKVQLSTCTSSPNDTHTREPHPNDIAFETSTCVEVSITSLTKYVKNEGGRHPSMDNGVKNDCDPVTHNSP